MPRYGLRGRRGILALTGVLAATAPVVFAQAPAINPTPIDQQTVRIVATLLENGHLTKPKINDEVSARWVKNYVKALDPRKYYFLKADIDEFHKYDTKLDDTIPTGDLAFAKLAMDRFQKRAGERFDQAIEILKTKPDFTVDESLTSDPDDLDYPATDADAKERLRKQLKFDLLRKKVGGKLSDEEAMKQVLIENRTSTARSASSTTPTCSSAT